MQLLTATLFGEHSVRAQQRYVESHRGNKESRAALRQSCDLFAARAFLSRSARYR
jgi:hypothetical protein